MIKIYGSPISFFVNKVRYVLNALGVEYEFQQLNMMAGEHKQEEHLQRHPAGKVPAVQDGDLTLFESNAIIRYYADTNGSKFYPKDAKQRAQVDQWIDFASIHVGGAMTRVVFNTMVAPMMPGMTVDEESKKCGQEFLAQFLPVIDQQLSKTKYLAADEMTLADFNLLAILDPAEAVNVDLSKYPNIAKWQNDLQAQAWYKQCHESFTDLVQNLMKTMAKA